MLTLRREIVDESDVYVDVHKAIRRLTPAPRARRNHADVAAAAEAAGTAIAAKKSADGTAFVDVAEDANGQPMVVGSLGALSDTSGDSEHSKLAVFMKRRSSVGPDGKPDTGVVPIKASLNEVKQQLRLGPANRAANPLSNTRGSVFKIKQGLTTVPSRDNLPRVSMDGVNTPVESTPLLNGTTNGNGNSHEADYGAKGVTIKSKPKKSSNDSKR